MVVQAALAPKMPLAPPWPLLLALGWAGRRLPGAGRQQAVGGSDVQVAAEPHDSKWKRRYGRPMRVDGPLGCSGLSAAVSSGRPAPSADQPQSGGAWMEGSQMVGRTSELAGQRGWLGRVILLPARTCADVAVGELPPRSPSCPPPPPASPPLSCRPAAQHTSRCCQLPPSCPLPPATAQRPPRNYPIAYQLPPAPVATASCRPATAKLPPSYRPATAQLPPSYRPATACQATASLPAQPPLPSPLVISIAQAAQPERKHVVISADVRDCRACMGRLANVRHGPPTFANVHGCPQASYDSPCRVSPQSPNYPVFAQLRCCLVSPRRLQIASVRIQLPPSRAAATVPPRNTSKQVFACDCRPRSCPPVAPSLRHVPPHAARLPPGFPPAVSQQRPNLARIPPRYHSATAKIPPIGILRS